MVSVKLFAGFFKKDFCCALTIKFQNFLSACNFAVNAEMPDRIRVWKSAAVPLRLPSCAHLGSLKGQRQIFKFSLFCKIKVISGKNGRQPSLTFSESVRKDAFFTFQCAISSNIVASSPVIPSKPTIVCPEK